MRSTLQRDTWSAILPLSLRFKADIIDKLRRLDCYLSTLTLCAQTKLLLQNVPPRFFLHKIGFTVTMTKMDGDQVDQCLGHFVYEWNEAKRLSIGGAMVQVDRNTEYKILLK
mmetsp:Transcript_14448/g.20603  ORF Transcript_14448/g.20603 Transcript_14448/m.20603 type:complete len:112 (+) Transcript_14448:258-593(+)